MDVGSEVPDSVRPGRAYKVCECRSALPFLSVNVPGRAGYDPHLQRHHLLPRQMLARPCLGSMLGRLGERRLGFHDFRRNGLLLPATESAARRSAMPLHRGPHRHYNGMVLERVGQIEASWQRHRRGAGGQAGLDADVEALMRLDLLQRALRRRLLDARRWHGALLNRHDPALDFSHLDAMADMLWAQTEQ